MCLRSQGIDNDRVSVGRLKRARGLNNDDGGIGRGRGIDDASKGSETTTGAARIRGRQRRMRSCDDGPEELVTTTEASVEKDEPKDLTTTIEAS